MQRRERDQRSLFVVGLLEFSYSLPVTAEGILHSGLAEGDRSQLGVQVVVVCVTADILIPCVLTTSLTWFYLLSSLRLPPIVRSFVFLRSASTLLLEFFEGILHGLISDELFKLLNLAYDLPLSLLQSASSFVFSDSSGILIG